MHLDEKQVLRHLAADTPDPGNGTRSYVVRLGKEDTAWFPDYEDRVIRGPQTIQYLQDNYCVVALTERAVR